MKYIFDFSELSAGDKVFLSKGVVAVATPEEFADSVFPDEVVVEAEIKGIYRVVRPSKFLKPYEPKD